MLPYPLLFSSLLQLCGFFQATCQADFSSVLLSKTSKQWLTPFSKLTGQSLTNSTLLDFSSNHLQFPFESISQDDQLLSLCVAIASLQSFIQLNWTGPELEDSLFPLNLLRTSSPDSFPPRSLDLFPNGDSSKNKRGPDGGGLPISAHSDVPSNERDSKIHKSIHDASLDQLSAGGEPAYHLCRSPFLLMFSIKILETLSQVKIEGDGKRLETIAWWRLRAETVQRHVLDEAVPYSPSVNSSIKQLLEELASRSQKEVGNVEDSNRGGSSWKSVKPWSTLYSQLLLENGLALQRIKSDRAAADSFVEAAKAHGLRYQLSGALGKRTKFQREDKMQLVLLAESAKWVGIEGKEKGDDSTKSIKGKEREDQSSSTTEEKETTEEESRYPIPSAIERSSKIPSTLQHNDDTLLEQTKFTSTSLASTGEKSSTNEGDLSHLSPSDQPALHPLDQSILLALSLNLRNTSPAHGLVASQISSFVSRVLSHPMNWSVHTVALLLRSRLEASRTRTAERSVLQLQALLDQMPATTADDAPASLRLKYFFSLELPARWELEAELAKRYAALGAIRSSLEAYERLEMWDEVVQCLSALGRDTEGSELVRELLEGRKREANEETTLRKKGSAALDSKSLMRLSHAREGKLWCLLGDLEPDNSKEHYEKAWNTSLRSSARAARSLGGYHFVKGEMEKSIYWLRKALKLNTLTTRSWFMLGCALMRLSSALEDGSGPGSEAGIVNPSRNSTEEENDKRWADAARAFARCTALDEEDAESWNNLASCYLRMGKRMAKRLDNFGIGENASVGEMAAELSAVDEDEEEDGFSDSDSISTETTTSSTITNSSTVSFGGSETSNESIDREEPEPNDQEQEEAARAGSTSRSRSTPYSLSLRAHTALTHAVRLSHDSWRVWYNLMIVSVDVGLLSDAARAMSRVVEIRTSDVGGKRNEGGGMGQGSIREKEKEQVVDLDVLQRLVDAVVRAPSKQEDALEMAKAEEQAASQPSIPSIPSPASTAFAAPASQNEDSNSTSTNQIRISPHEGHGLYPTVSRLFITTLLPRFSFSSRIFLSHSKLLLWRGQNRAALESLLRAFKCGQAAELTGEVESDGTELLKPELRKRKWWEALQEIEDVVSYLENFGEKKAGPPLGYDLNRGSRKYAVGLDEIKEEDVDEETLKKEEEEEAMKDWKFRARSLIRTFMARTKEDWEDEEGWERLIELRDGLK